MRKKKLILALALPLMVLAVSSLCASAALNPNPPASPVKLIFIHHSTGQNWLNDENGGLGSALRDNNYFVSDTNYGWGPDAIGDRTDIGNWWDWFRGSNSGTYLNALHTESGQNSEYSRLATDPGGQNEIIMFKSCFPNSRLEGNTNDPPFTGNNLLRGQDSSSEYMTVANAKGIYNDILAYFATRQDKLFIAITAPPLSVNDTDVTTAANARAFNNWLVNDWLRSYSHNNVAVFDFYNVLTSNGGNATTNDVGQESGNHHRWRNSAIQHIQTVNNNMASYPSEDSHPTAAGGQKATAEYTQLLNIFYHRWKDGGTPAIVPINVSGITTNLSGPPSLGQNVQISFTANGATSSPYYRYWLASGYQTANYGNWQPLQTWTHDTSVAWSPASEDHYVLVAWVCDTQGSSEYHQAGLTIQTAGHGTNPIQITGMTTDVSFPQPAGTPVHLSTAATGGAGPLSYQYWYQLENGPWTIIRAWDTDSSATWTPPQAGRYIVVVWVSDDTSVTEPPLAGMHCTIGN